MCIVSFLHYIMLLKGSIVGGKNYAQIQSIKVKYNTKMTIQALKQNRNLRRKLSIRKKIFGTLERPRLSVFKSATNIYVQLINDVESKTILSASSIDKEVRGLIDSNMNKSQVSKIVGEAIAKRAKEANISKVVFDRNGNLYRGRVKALADAARESGLIF